MSTVPPGLKTKLYENDPLLRLFIDVLHLNWWRAALAYIGFWLVESLLFAYSANVFLPNPAYISFLDDLPGQIVFLWTGIIVLGYYIWSATSFSSLIWRLQQNGSLYNGAQRTIPIASSKGYRWVAQRLYITWNEKAWFVGAVACTIFWISFLYFPVYRALIENGYWWSLFLIYRIWFLLKIAVWIYIAFRIVSLEALSIYSLLRLVTWNALVYRAYHPDAAAGLSAIGKQRLGIVYGLLGLSLYSVFFIIQKQFGYSPSAPVIGSLNLPDLLIILLIVVCFPVFFFGPILRIHGFMREEKYRKISPFAEQANQTIDSLKAIDSSNESTLNALLNLLNELKEAPEWPYNSTTLRRFLGAWGTFVLGLIIAFITELFANSLN